ncbi:ABC transporter substrate-binding protein [Oceanispirochaeta sp.]|uniref:ABC transporter substrate-binding protein n=1 Tax=Oceanispirochaeta sp. TaxID=2035350 RepID=UPI002629E5B6|nr:ABC transporter substrate-binding protein [Oceanispirochaeta sp.]MDA3957283.1 ABC transporter substrate-binding protein [Oceanispirochaeta sp.]
MKKKTLLLFLVMLAFSIASVSSAGQSDSSAPAADENAPLVIAIEPDYFTFDPGYAYELYAPMVIGVVYDNLFQVIPSSDAPVPQLAKSYKVSDSGLVYTFTLRQDAKFTSGNPVMAKDVKFSFDRALNLQSNASALMDGIVSVDVVDDYTVSITIAKADSAFVSKTTSTAFAVLDSVVIMAQGGVSDSSAPTADKAQTYLDHQSAGSGPYILQSFTADDKLILVRNENYWGDLPEFKTIIIQDMPDENAQLLAVKGGDIDIAFNLSSDQLSQLDGSDVQVISGSTMTMGFLMMNNNPAIGKQVSDANVQKAIRYAVDYQGLQTLIGAGTVTPESFIQVGFMGSKDPINTSTQNNLKKAKDFLSKSAYPDGFSIDFTVCDLAPEGIPLTLIAEKIKSDLEKIGISINIVQDTWGGGFGDAYREGTVGFTAMYWGPDYYDPNTQLAFLPGQYVGLRAGWTGDMNPDLAGMYDKIVAEADLKTRTKMIKDVVTETGADSPFIVYAQYPKYIAASSALKGVNYSNLYRLDLAAVTK